MGNPKEKTEGVTKSVSTEMAVGKKCKSCIRFESSGDTEMVTTSLYLMNGAWALLGNPESITITVTPKASA